MELHPAPDLETHVVDQVQRGAFGSARDVVADALREKMREDDVADRREKLRRSEEDIKAGRTVADDAFFEAKRGMIRGRHMKPAQ